jgi:signal recognition particle receptor subunit alpha
MQPVLEKLKDHLITKNVAADIAHKLCDSVATKLEGKVSTLLQTFTAIEECHLLECYTVWHL